MTDRQSLAATVHDAIDEVTTAVEGIHKSVADMPLDMLAEITPLQSAVREVKDTQDQVIGAVYDLVRTINGQVRRLTTGEARREAA
jgi:uncharacterized protein YoxC